MTAMPPKSSQVESLAGSPPGRPAEALNDLGFAQVTAETGGSGDQDYFPLQGKPSPYPAAALVTALEVRYAVSLSQRDGAILRAIAGHRFLRTDQIRRVFFSSLRSPAAQARSCTRVLRRLADHRLIDALPQRIGGVKRGSAAMVWHVTKRTAIQLRALGDHVTRPHVFGQPEFLAHTLEVAEAHVRLVELDRRGDVEVLQVQLEPASWRHPPGAGAAGSLRPDMFVVTAQGDYETHRFIEIDRGTESLPRILTKCERYTAYYESGIEQADNGVFPTVLWVAPSAARARGIQSAIAKVKTDATDLFTVCVSEELESEIVRK